MSSPECYVDFLQKECEKDADEVAIAVEEMADVEGVIVLVPMIGEKGHGVAPTHRDEEDGQNRAQTGNEEVRACRDSTAKDSSNDEINKCEEGSFAPTTAKVACALSAHF